MNPQDCRSRTDVVKSIIIFKLLSFDLLFCCASYKSFPRNDLLYNASFNLSRPCFRFNLKFLRSVFI